MASGLNRRAPDLAFMATNPTVKKETIAPNPIDALVAHNFVRNII